MMMQKTYQMDYCIKDYGSTYDDDSSFEDVIDEDDASDSEDNEENHLVFIVFCETYVNVLRTGRISWVQKRGHVLGE